MNKAPNHWFGAFCYDGYDLVKCKASGNSIYEGIKYHKEHHETKPGEYLEIFLHQKVAQVSEAFNIYFLNE